MNLGVPKTQPVIEQCPCLVPKGMNGALMIQVNLEEVKEAMFQMCVSKAPGPDGLDG